MRPVPSVELICLHTRALEVTMARILFAWELGGDLGHLMRLAPLARQLRERGHHVVVAVRDLSRAAPILDGVPVLQAPIWLPRGRSLPQAPACYPDILQHYGYLSVAGLKGLIKAWRALYELTCPDLILFDHAPTALLASRGLRAKRLLVGTGFMSPPRASPMPSMRPWLTVPAEYLQESERKVLTTINQVMSEMNLPRLDALQDLFEVDDDLLTTFPDLDHLPHRGKGNYLGPVVNEGTGAQPKWAGNDRPKVFAYLKGSYPHLEGVIAALAQAAIDVNVFCPDIPGPLAMRYRDSALHIGRAPVKMSAVLSECDWVVCHGGHDTTALTLLHGKPLLLLPMHLEQFLLARKVQRMGTGVLAAQEHCQSEIVPGIESLIRNQDLTAQARLFADRHKTFSLRSATDAITARCETLSRHASSSA